MQTRLLPRYRDTAWGREAEGILRSCVHCGFCTATCPTYQLLGDELDGPRGRIYLIKEMLEGEPVGATTRCHLDRCLTCRSCETTCPSGVAYARLLDSGRELIERLAPRPWSERMIRGALRRLLPWPGRLRALTRVGAALRPVLPASLRAKLPAIDRRQAWPTEAHSRRVILATGCAQQALRPATNAALARLLDRLGVTALDASGQGCCGAVSQHLAAADEARVFARRNIAAWWPLVESGAEAILIAASGCGVMVKDYAHLLASDPEWRARAAQIASLALDPVEYLERLDLAALRVDAGRAGRIAFHAPCTLQHGQRLSGRVERLLGGLGFELTPVADAHLCCGSAGTYSILHAELAERLRERKLAALGAGAPARLVTANIGCQLHLEAGAGERVWHWLELLDELAGA